MRNFICFSVILAFVISSSTVLAWTWPNDVTFLGLQKISSEIKMSVFAVQIKGNIENKDRKDDFISLGTGFLLTRDKLVIGVTCDHVIRPAIAQGKTILIGLDTGKGFQRFECDIGKRDQTHDIATLLPRKPANVPKIKLKNLVLDTKYLAESTMIIEGRGVIIPGDPLGIGVEHDENHPVIRFGIVAQYTGRNYFLIDGVANPGNSGSPVFDLREAKFIGMITSYKSDFIDLFDRNGRQVAKLPYNSGLSQAISADKISELLK